eukprot:15428263-Alexandrium_andersonii.AAC.1
MSPADPWPDVQRAQACPRTCSQGVCLCVSQAQATDSVCLRANVRSPLAGCPPGCAPPCLGAAPRLGPLGGSAVTPLSPRLGAAVLRGPRV